MRPAKPPRLARWLLERFGTASRLHSLIGDLAEEYANGRSGAWYWQQALGTVALDFLRALRTHPLSFIVATITGARRRHRTREDAFAWLARLRRGLRDEEGPELLQWLKRRSHRTCIARSAAESGGPEALAVLGEMFLVNPEWVDPPQRRNPAINVAAALTATCIAALPLLYTHHYMPGLILGRTIEGSFADTMSTVYANDQRTLRRAVLPDGTPVLMNRGTRIAVLGRSVRLMRGEAAFIVARRGLPPFELTVADRLFDTTSAVFNVRLVRTDAAELTVLEGTVTQLPFPRRAAVNKVVPPESDERRFVPLSLNALQTLELGPGTESRHTLSRVEALSRIAWQRE